MYTHIYAYIVHGGRKGCPRNFPLHHYITTSLLPSSDAATIVASSAELLRSARATPQQQNSARTRARYGVPPIRGNRLSNTTCLLQAFFRHGE